MQLEMTSAEQREFLNCCMDFRESCIANGLDTHLIITSKFVRVICKPKGDFEEHFYYILNDSLETLKADLMSDLEFIRNQHLNK